MSVFANNLKIEKGESLLLVALALFGMDFMLQGIMVLIVYGFYFVMTNKGTSVPGNSTILAFSLLFLLFYMFVPVFELSILKTMVAISLAFLLGSRMKNCTPEKIVFYMVFVAFFMALHAMLNMYYNFSQMGMMAIAERASYDFWTRDISSSTGQASKMTPFLACSFYLIMYNKNKALKYLSIILLLLNVIYNLELGGRSALVLLFFTIILSYLIGSIRAKSAGSSAKFLVILVFFCIAIYFAYEANLFGIQDLFENSSFNQRFNGVSGQDINEDDRTRRKIIYLQNLLTYPFGGQHLCNDLKIGHAHDLWLDTFDMAGLIPLFILLYYTYSSIIRAYRLYKKQTVDPYKATVILTFFVIMNAQFYLEPIIEGSPKLFIYYCLIDAMVSQCLMKQNYNLTVR